MAWNEPGGGNKDPWGGKGGDQGGPPDLDEVVRKLQERLGGLFGGKRSVLTEAVAMTVVEAAAVAAGGSRPYPAASTRRPSAS